MTASMLGVLRPSIYRFKLGAFEVTTILDGVMLRDGPHPFFGNDQSAEAVQAYATAHRLPATKMENGFTITLVNTGAELVLFDTGNGATRKEIGCGNLCELMHLAGYTPEQVDVIAFTHCHPDHIGGLVENGAPTFPNARYLFGRAEFDYWRKGENISESRQATRALFMKVALPFGEQAAFLEPGNDVVSGISSVGAHGHSAGHMAYHVESEGQRLLIWGDVTNHAIMSLQKPEWHVAPDDDKEMAVETRKRILDMVAAEQIPAIGYHMPFPSVGYVVKSSAGFRWAPVTYQLTI